MADAGAVALHDLLALDSVAHHLFPRHAQLNAVFGLGDEQVAHLPLGPSALPEQGDRNVDRQRPSQINEQPVLHQHLLKLLFGEKGLALLQQRQRQREHLANLRRIVFGTEGQIPVSRRRVEQHHA